ncbi:hypothetical protein [Vibrio atypicus]|uniref:hypothetical protein n=1 Tax=Vibrio atypicus TaxID=558271 RepID=UPI0037369271
MTLNKTSTELQAVSNNLVHHMCVKLLVNQGLNESEANSLLDIELYLSNPLDTNVVITECMNQSLSHEQASLRILKQKQRGYFALLLHSYWEAEARKYFDCMEQVKSI